LAAAQEKGKKFESRAAIGDDMSEEKVDDTDGEEAELKEEALSPGYSRVGIWMKSCPLISLVGQ